MRVLDGRPPGGEDNGAKALSDAYCLPELQRGFVDSLGGIPMRRKTAAEGVSRPLDPVFEQYGEVMEP